MIALKYFFKFRHLLQEKTYHRCNNSLI